MCPHAPAVDAGVLQINIRQHKSAYVSIRQHTSYCSGRRWRTPVRAIRVSSYCYMCSHTTTYLFSYTVLQVGETACSARSWRTPYKLYMCPHTTTLLQVGETACSARSWRTPTSLRPHAPRRGTCRSYDVHSIEGA